MLRLPNPWIPPGGTKLFGVLGGLCEIERVEAGLGVFLPLWCNETNSFSEMATHPSLEQLVERELISEHDMWCDCEGMEIAFSRPHKERRPDPHHPCDCRLDVFGI